MHVHLYSRALYFADEHNKFSYSYISVLSDARYLCSSTMLHSAYTLVIDLLASRGPSSNISYLQTIIVLAHDMKQPNMFSDHLQSCKDILHTVPNNKGSDFNARLVMQCEGQCLDKLGEVIDYLLFG